MEAVHSRRSPPHRGRLRGLRGRCPQGGPRSRCSPRRGEPQAARKAWRWASKASVSSFRRHSHTTNTVHPRACSRSRFAASRAMLPSSLRFQNSALVEGRRPFRQSCPCQKHPCTKTAVRYLRSARSGAPGRRRTFRRYRKPSRHTALRTCLSASVPRVRTLDMSKERANAERVSTGFTRRPRRLLSWG